MSGLEIHAEWAKTLATELIDGDASLPEGLTGDTRLALAWALKDIAIAAWSAAPANVPKAAEWLMSIGRQSRDIGAPSTAAEILAITDWVAGIACLTRGQMSEAIIHLDSGTRRFRERAQDAHAAHAQVPKIMALSVLGQHAEAAACGESTQRELTSLGELLAAGKVSLNLGNLHYQLNDFAKSLTQYQQAAELFGKAEYSQWTGMSQLGIANTLEVLGNFDAALKVYADIDRQTERHRFDVLRAMVHESRALLHLARGQYHAALAGLENARQRYEALDMQQQLATAEKQFADVYLVLRLLPEALNLYATASTRFERLQMPVERAWALAQQGRTLAALMRPEAEVTEALQLASALFAAQGVSAGSASVLHTRAEVALARGDTEQAKELATEAAEIFAKAGMAADTLQSRVVYAYAVLSEGNGTDAIPLFSSARHHAVSLQLISIQVRCLVGLGLSAVQQNSMQTAKVHFESAVELFEQQRRDLPGDDLRHSFLVDHMLPYQALLRIEFEHQAPEATACAAAILIQIERFRARVLGERMGNQQRVEAASESDAAIVEKRVQLNWLHLRLQKLLYEGETNNALLDESRRRERELLELSRRRRLTAPVGDQLGGIASFDPGALQTALSDIDVLVEYGVLDDELFACVVTRNEITVRRHMARWPEVIDAIRALRFQIETLRNGAIGLERHAELLTRRSRAASRKLHDLLWLPLAESLTGFSKVLVVPHEQLASVQFSALYDGEKYLTESWEMAVAPSATVALWGLLRQPVPPQHAVVLADSTHLLHAATEARNVASLFEQVTVLTGSDASSVALRGATWNADVLHLACHGQFRSDNPMFSALHLTDGPLTVQDVEALRLPLGIVVLSACESGVSTESRGDEVIGLVRAFLIAGAARVVASLWPVDDAVTSEFMAAFYQSLRSGAAPGAALRTAQLAVMRTHPHPFHWAAFTLYGGW